MITEKKRLKIYDKLRQAHDLVSDAFREYDNLDDVDKNALDGVGAVLYMAEGVFAKEKS